MTLEHLDPRGPAEDRGKQRGMVNVRVPGEGRVEREEPLDLLSRGPGHLDVSHCGTVVQGVNGEKSRDFLSVFVNILFF